VNEKRIFLPALTVLVIYWSILVIPAYCVHKEPGISVEKVLEITDGDESFYFKYPTRIYGDLEENIYVLDSSRLLKFSKAGNFIGNLAEKGQGPGEATNISNLYLTDGKIIVHNNYPSKIIWMNTAGKFIKEFRLEKSDYVKFSHYYSGRYFFVQSKIPAVHANESYKDVDHVLFSVDEEGKTWTKLYAFPVKEYIVKHGGAYGSFDIAKLDMVVWEGNYLMVSHTPRYGVKCFDPGRKKIIKEFGADYQPREIPRALSGKFNRGGVFLDGKMFRKPVQEHFNDIRGLLKYKERLWVVTSTVDETKGVRIDVYNFTGDKTGQFFLLLPGLSDMYSCNWCAAGDFLYALDRPEKGEPKILKYKISCDSF
jgi:hypothetical protein